MLSSIKIKGLYGLYTYTIDFLPEEKAYRFVTGPNAYGKTSLLRMIAALYQQDFRQLSSVTFDEFVLTYDDNYKIEVSEKRYYDPDTDETAPKRVILTFASGNSYNQAVRDIFEWDSDREDIGRLNNLTAYLASHPIYMITDNRLYINGTGEPVGQGIENGMKNYLRDLDRRLNSLLQQGMLEEQQPISKADYNERIGMLKPIVDSAMRYELIKRNPIPAYTETEAAFCHRCIVALEQTFTGRNMEAITRLDTFCKIIDGYGFANKHLELSPYFGMRFMADDEMSSILTYDQLSSGEKHILLMNYDILFDVPDEALVLIDEPELSFHLEWQGQFMSNLDEVVAVRDDLQFIICTHSPEMFGYEWGLSTDLFEQAE